MKFSKSYNENIQKIAKFIKNEQKYDFYVVISHDNPDCDAISSTIALEYLLSSFGKDTVCLNSDKPAPNLALFDSGNICLDYEKALNRINLNLTRGMTFCLIVTDTHEMRMTGKFADSGIPDKAVMTFCIDHHEVRADNDAEYICCNSDKSSVCEIIYDIYVSMNVKIPKKIGDALYAGIVSDTGLFRFAKTSASVFAAASALTANGTNPSDIYRILFEHESVSQLLAKKSVWQTLELHDDNRIAVITLTRLMLEQTGVSYNETGELSDIPLSCENVQAVIFCKENEQGRKKIAMRSKGNLDIAQIAHRHGGGGHKNAAGFKLSAEDDISEMKHIIIEEISKIL